MESVPDLDLLDSFGLENDKEIDFETAYRMISNFDEDLSRPQNDSMLCRLDFGGSGGLVGMAPSNLIATSHSGQEGHVEALQEQHRGQQKEDIQNRLGDDQVLSKAELLSTYESNAIEHFLDSMIFQDNATVPTTMTGGMINTEDLKVTKKMEKVVVEEKKRSPALDTSSLEVYIPPTVEVPILCVDDKNIPTDVLQDPIKLRKWKHVESERLRRCSTKRIFDDLISMARYPRIQDPKITKPQTEKRVPKHTLLNFILEDLQSLLRANEELETLLRQAESKEKKSAKNGLPIF